MVYKESIYLGTYAIPLTTILNGSKYEGNIMLNRPLIIQNYRVVQDEIVFMEKDKFKEEQKRIEE